ncbi:hypothetical protein [Humisphaera borealis]|uniref:Uncharacterized protein n=1 Tax=Humisphaera borealis TaxID=2807512 RepID=A0A7M2WWM7_9BACT|nr:hypothetical protein [Humisphaera borealis]QOV89876.1 hypothetical protein IPV69_00430 [Humisphaera borealis]
MDAFFKQLGGIILERWKCENFSLAKFPDIACLALDERPPAEHVDLGAFMRQFLFDDEQPAQTDSDFGQPELIAFSHPRFYIQVLFWLDGTTAIHQHEFSGAFHVMHGSSIHAQYEFDNAQTVTPYLRVGNVRMKHIELLETGRTVPIVSGSQDIHSLFHLDTPSISVVVRTQHDPGTGPQLNYLPPHIAMDPHSTDMLSLRRRQLLDVLEQTGNESYAGVMMDMIADLDFERGFHMLRHGMGHLQYLDQWDAALAAFQERHGKLATGVAATLSEEARRESIKRMRGTITEPDHRFFLALLMNAPTRADLLALVAQRFPDETPTDKVLRWVEELTEITDEGVAALDAIFPQTVEVDAEEQPELFVAALKHFMSGSKKPTSVLKGLSAQDVKELRTAFAESSLRVLTV